MVEAPLPPGLRPGGAADDRSGLEHRLSKLPQQKSQYLVQARRQRHVERICRTPRLVAELLDELARYHGLGEDIDRRLEGYAGLDLELLHAVEADRFPASPVRVVGGRP
jgi:hypothetical protein